MQKNIFLQKAFFKLFVCILSLGSFYAAEQKTGSHYQSANKIASFDASNKANGTPLIVALKNSNHKDVTRLLPLTTLTNNFGKTPFHELVHYKEPIEDTVLDIIIPHIDINAQEEEYKKTALCLAIQNNNFSLVNYLLKQKNIDVHLGEPLHTAVSLGNLAIIKALASHPSINNINDSSKELKQPTALSLALTAKDSIEIMKILINNGANVFAKTKSRRAQKQSHQSILEMEWLYKQKDSSIADGFKKALKSDNAIWPLLAEAIYLNNPKVVAFLLEKGCNPDEVITESFTVRHYAEAIGNTDILEPCSNAIK